MNVYSFQGLGTGFLSSEESWVVKASGPGCYVLDTLGEPLEGHLTRIYPNTEAIYTADRATLELHFFR
jgi:hypothetical protein